MILIDVGAAGEILPRFSSIKEKTIVAFEPDPEAYDELKTKYSSKNYVIINEALSSQEQSIKINFTNKGECSSIFRPNLKLLEKYPYSDRFKVKETAKIQTNTLDNILKNEGIENPNFIKLDIQGAELDALKGGLESLKTISCIELEIEFAELYEGQPLFSEIEQFLRSQGFEVWDIRRVFQKNRNSLFFGSKKGRLISGDALFFKNTRKLHIDLQELDEDSWNKAILSSLEIAKVYGYSDYIVELLKDAPSNRNIKPFNNYLNFSKKDWLSVKSILSMYRYKISKFLSKKLFSYAQRVDPYDSGFKIGDSSLGNKKIK